MLRVVADDDARVSELSLDFGRHLPGGSTPDAERRLGGGAGRLLGVVRGELDADGHRLVVGNGRARSRVVATGAGPIEVEAPRVNDKRVDEETGERCRFRSQILATWCRKSPKVSAVLPLMFLHGMSSGDFVTALGEFFGSDAGLSASVVTRLTKSWQEERARFADRSLADVDFVYCWADGVHFNVRLEEERLCCLVIVGVRADGTKELVAIADGYRESTGSWADLLRDGQRRAMRAPTVMVGDGALGMWSALGEVFPETRHQRCWVHKAANVLSALPKSVHPSGRRALAEIRDAEDRGHAEAASRASPTTSGRSGPRQSPRSSMTPRCCSPSSTSRPSTGCTSRRPTRSSRPSPPCGFGRR